MIVVQKSIFMFGQNNVVCSSSIYQNTEQPLLLLPLLLFMCLEWGSQEKEKKETHQRPAECTNTNNLILHGIYIY